MKHWRLFRRLKIQVLQLAFLQVSLSRVTSPRNEVPFRLFSNTMESNFDDSNDYVSSTIYIVLLMCVYIYTYTGVSRYLLIQYSMFIAARKKKIEN
jgi:hypothetical protein